MKNPSQPFAEPPLAAPPDTGRIGDLLVEAVARFGPRVAFIDGDCAISYEALGRRIAQALAGLEALGLQRGDAVAQLAGNRIEMFCLMAACYIGGYRSVTLHTAAGASDHAAILADCAARLVVSEHAQAARMDWLRAHCPPGLQWRSHDEGDGVPGFWRDTDEARGDAALQVVGEPGDIVRLAYTGGTTGRAKGVMLSSRAMRTNTQLWLAGIDWPDGVRTLCSAPISHGAGSLIYPTLARGGTVVLQHGFTVPSWFEAVARHRIQHTFIVPTMLYALLDAHEEAWRHDLGSLRALVYGAAPASPSRIRQALELFGPVLVQTYGQTEAPNTILLLDQRAHADASDLQLAAAGRPFPGVDVALMHEDGQAVALGEVGEICVRGDLLMSGYHGQPEQTRATVREGWLRTGDMARRDSQGLFHIVDRKKDMVITGGFNVYPREIEDVLSAHPAVASVAVIGVPDAKWGEAVKAVVVLRAGHAATPEALIAYVRERKGAVCVPKTIDFVDQVPLTGLGKPDKKALRKRYWAEHQREIA